VRKQINPSIKAHLLRSALILLSLIAICAIPFALAQSRSRGTAKPSAIKPATQPIPAAKMQNSPPPTDAAIAHQLPQQGEGASRSDVPFLQPQTALVPGRPAVCILAGTLGTAPPGGGTGTLATRIFRPGTPTSTCAGVIPPSPFNIDTGPFIYNVHYITNSGGSPLCTTVTLHVATEGTAVTNMQCSAFMAPFTAGDITNQTRYLGDAGVSTANPPADTAFQLTIPASTTIALVVLNVNVSPAGQGTVYQVILDQDIFCQQVTPTPTATGTPSPTATATPTSTATSTPTPAPSATATPTPPGSCTSYEAESDNNTLTGSAVVLNCPTCSGGVKVGYVGNNSGTLQFNGVSAVAPGRYSVTICYANGDPVRYALLSVNGSPGTPLSFPSTGSFQTVGSIQTTITLNTGNNTLEFYNPIVGSWAPDFDRIQFNCPTSYLGNISTRSFVQTGDNVMIGGFMVQGNRPKSVILRAIGPELSQYGIPNAMADPTMELHNANGALIASNDDWQTTIIGGIITSDQVQDIEDSGHAPGNPLESAIIADLPPGSYTAIVRGVSNTTGVALVEAYDLSPSLHSILGNISTRSLVQTGDDVMIGGFIVRGTQPKNVIIRAIGPELSQYGVPDPLADPTLELHNGTGALIASNDNWRHTIIGGIITSNQVQDIQNSGHAPGNPRESAIIANLPPGNYTAIVRGVNNTTGVALVEVYDLH
jgi:Alpha-galactosidase, CBM13 domain